MALLLLEVHCDRGLCRNCKTPKRVNAQHSINTGEWYTPAEWLALVRAVLGSIGLDPCSSKAASFAVGAPIYLTESDNPLKLPWHEIADTAFINPPGCCRKGFLGYMACDNRKNCSCRLPRKFLEKTITECALGMSAIYLAYSVNQLRQLSSIAIASHLSVSIAMPAKRIPYVDPVTMKMQRGTNCDSAFVLISEPVIGTSHKRFADVFSKAPDLSPLSPCAVYSRREPAKCFLP